MEALCFDFVFREISISALKNLQQMETVSHRPKSRDTTPVSRTYDRVLIIRELRHVKKTFSLVHRFVLFFYVYLDTDKRHRNGFRTLDLRKQTMNESSLSLIHKPWERG